MLLPCKRTKSALGLRPINFIVGYFLCYVDISVAFHGRLNGIFDEKTEVS
jgi:hypothetical protein